MNFKTQYPLYTSGDMKKEAKAQLQGNWTRAAILCLVPGLVTLLIGYNTVEGNSLLSFVMNLVIGLFTTGVAFALLDLLRNTNYMIEPLQDIIQVFRREYFLNLIFLKVRILVFIFFWSLLFVIPGIVKAYSYSQAELIYKDIVDSTGIQPSAKECMDKSQEMMKGRKADLFALDLSFIGWYFLAALTLGILYIWINPYARMSRVVFYENISEELFIAGSSRESINNKRRESYEMKEEVGKDPDDFSDFYDF